MIVLKDIQKNPEIAALIEGETRVMDAMGYTEHGIRHVGYVSITSGEILMRLGYSEHLQELARIAGYLHDVGNAINRHHHGLSGAVLVYPILREMKMPMEDICIILAAIGNHEEEIGQPVNEVCAAVIIADKSDAHRTRVSKKYNPYDIHDRVNFAIKKNWVTVVTDKKIIRQEIIMDGSSSVMEYMQIYMSRMVISEKAANLLGCKYELVVNGMSINNPLMPMPANGMK